MKWARLFHFERVPGDAFWRSVLVFVILAAGFGVRILDLTDPPLDFHATRQLRSAILARSVYYQLNAQADPLLRQKAVELAKLEIYEPSILETMVGFTDFLLGAEYFWLGRVYNAFFWCLGGLLLFLIGRRFYSFPASLTGILVFLYLPFSVVASRSFQPDPWMVMWILLAFYTLLRWSEAPESWKWTLLAGLSASMALLVKISAAFFVLPMLLALVLTATGWRKFFRGLQFWILVVLIVAPSLGYYFFLNPQRSTGFFSFWIVSLSDLVLQSHFYAGWLAMIKGLIGLLPLVAALLGVLIADRPLRPVLVAGWAGYALLGLVFPYQYLTHEYYHLPLLALTALSLIPLIEVVYRQLCRQDWIWRLAGLVILLFSSFYGLYVSRSILVASNYALEPASWRRVGEALPENKSFIALTADYGMRLNYYGWRVASDYWPSTADLKLFSLGGNDPLVYEKYFDEVTAGKDYFLVTALSELEIQSQLKELLYNHFPVYYEGNGFIIFDLTKPKD